MRKSKFLFAFLVLSFYVSCNKDSPQGPEYLNPLAQSPTGFPSIPWPEDNAFSEARWKLGKKLFFDPVLSKNKDVSCSSCHHPNLGFSDSLSTSPGTLQRPGTRNSPSLANVAFQPYYLREGSVPTLEMQVLVPIQEHNEFDHNIVDIADSLNQIALYVQMSQEAYNRTPDAFVITRALACFQRTLVSGNSKYDLFLRGKETLSESELRGKEIFFSSRSQCSSCHGGFNFTSYEIENNGLYLNFADIGRARFTFLDSDIGKFKIPSLRNVEFTAPYMHDGSLQNLDEVIEHYSRGGKGHPNQSSKVTALHFSEQEKADLIAFLKSLSDMHFLTNPAFRN